VWPNDSPSHNRMDEIAFLDLLNSRGSSSAHRLILASLLFAAVNANSTSAISDEMS
jgi:hypothetical protein